VNSGGMRFAKEKNPKTLDPTKIFSKVQVKERGGIG
jgi:hypothetical protein